MSRSPQELLNLATKFEKIAIDIPQPATFEEDFTKWLKSKENGPITIREMPAIRLLEPVKKEVVVDELPKDDHEDLESFLEKDDDHEKSKSASLALILVAKKKEHKLDPKAKTRNRGTVVFPAESSSVKDHKDHFPINDEDQARNAWSRVHQYSSAPDWYKGSLKSLQDAVKRKVHSKYPGIEFEDKKKKKSSLQSWVEKYGDDPGF